MLIRNFFHRSIRLHFLFLFCVTWYIFNHFGGYKWNSIDFIQGRQGMQDGYDSFCQDSLHKLQFMELNYNKAPGQRRETNVGYWLFATQFLIQIIWMSCDLRSDWKTNAVCYIALLMDFFNVSLSVLILISDI